jgi:hypothetical protein
MMDNTTKVPHSVYQELTEAWQRMAKAIGGSDNSVGYRSSIDSYMLSVKIDNVLWFSYLQADELMEASVTGSISYLAFGLMHDILEEHNEYLYA